MKKLCMLLLAALPLLAVAQDKIMQDDNVVVRIVPEFHSVKVNSAINLYLSKGNETKVAVSTSDKNLIDNLTTVVNDGVLYIGFKNKINTGKLKLNAYVSYATLRYLQASGATDVKFIEPLEQDEFELSASGASDINISVKVKTLTAKISGASDVNVAGIAESAKLAVSGASNFKGLNLQTGDAMISTTGASDVSIQANKSIYVAASGASSVKWKGDANDKEIRTSGASSVKKVN